MARFNRGRWASLPVGIVIVTFFLIISTVSSAQSSSFRSPSASESESFLDTAAAERADAAQYAASFGTSPDEAARRLRLQSEIPDLALEWSQALGERFAGAWIEHHPEFGLVVMTTDASVPVPSELIFSARTPEIPVRFVEVDHSVSDLENLRDQLVLDDYLAAYGVGVGIDIRKNRVYIDSPVDSSKILATDRELVVTPIANPDESVEIPTSSRVEVRYGLNSTGDYYLYGGEKLDTDGNWNNGTDRCTTGFTVRSTTNNVPAITTAGHCPNALKYLINSSTNIDLNFRFEVVNAGGDDFQVLRHYGGHTYRPYFRADYGELREQTGSIPSASIMVGQIVTRFGQRTGASMVVVTDPTFAPGGSYEANNCNGNCQAKWVKAGQVCFGSTCVPFSSNGGDSGGPVFSGTTAFGFHSGSSACGGQCQPDDFIFFQPFRRIWGSNLNLLFS